MFYFSSFTTKNNSITIKIKKMNKQQFIKNFEKHSPFLRGYALNLTKNNADAQDLFQETALKSYKARKSFTINTNMKAWLSMIMKNTFINIYRKKKRRNTILESSIENNLLSNYAQTEVMYNDGETNFHVNNILEEIEALSDQFKIPFLMSYNGYKYKEIQKALGGLPLGTIKSRIHTARKTLQTNIKNKYQEVAA